MPTKLAFRRFKDLTANDINVELQLHTTQTDGKNTIEEMLQTAQSLGLHSIAFTEHVRHETTWFPEFTKDIERLAPQFHPLQVFVGCEAKALDTSGGLDVADEVRAQCDIVLGSVHRFPASHDESDYLNWDELDDETFARTEFDLALGLAKYAPIDVLSHPGGMYERKRQRVFPEAYFRELMLTTLGRGIAIEINSSYLRDPDLFLKLCEEINPFVSIGSDAHHVSELGKCRDMLRQKGVGR